MTIPLRESLGETVSEQDMIDAGPQHIAPVVTWLASAAAQHVTGEIIHAVHGLVGIMQQPTMQQPTIVRSFQQERAWTLDELDLYIPKLLQQKKQHDRDTADAGKPEIVKPSWSPLS